MRIRAAILGALCALAFYLRTGPFEAVFQGGFVNFSETDAWFHVRMAENLIRHFPWRIAVDPYASVGALRPVAAGPFFDWALALIAMIAGLGHPSEALLDTIAAWYPAVLGTLIVPVVYVLARDIFNVRAGLIAAAVVATLPGHFLKVGSVGFTDHHVMESLLTALLLWMLVRGRGVAAGLVLGAYLLTFSGGAWLVALIVIWAAYEIIRSLWPREEPAPPLRPVLLAFGIGLAMVAPFYGVFWMGYSIAALVVGLVVLPVLDWSSSHVRRGVFLAGLGAVLVVAVILTPRAVREILFRLAPGFVGKTGGVEELESLVFRNGHFSLAGPWEQFAGAAVLALIGVVLLGELAVRRPTARRNLIFFFGLATMVMAAGQLRMTYYFAIAVAVFSGYIADAMLNVKAMLRPVVAVVLIAAVIAPNIWRGFDTAEEAQSATINQDWRETLDWLRGSTPEPFGDADYYYSRYRPPVRSADYSVMSWWDFGYWITAVARRVPVSNPTQLHAEVAAEFLLSQSEAEALAILEKWRSRYVVISHQMVLEEQEGMLSGLYTAFFEYAPDRDRDRYFMTVYQRDADGGLTGRTLFLPAYYRSMAVRLFLYGGAAVEQVSKASVATIRNAGRYRELTGLREFSTEEEARAAAENCKSDQCIVAGVGPLQSAVKLEGMTRFKQVFASSSPAVHLASGAERSIVQVYQVQPD